MYIHFGDRETSIVFLLLFVHICAHVHYETKMILFVNRTKKHEHLFFHCDIVKPIWRDVVLWLSPEISFIQPLIDKNVLVGFKEVHRRLVNNILLIVKKYFYVCRCMEKIPIMFSVFNEVKKYYSIDKILC